LPALYLLATSFTPLDLTRPETQWTSRRRLQNYRLAAVGRAAAQLGLGAGQAVVWTVGLQLTIGLGLALLLNLRSRYLEALAHDLPDPDGACRRSSLRSSGSHLHARTSARCTGSFGLLGWNVPALITHPDLALMAIIIAETWSGSRSPCLMILAALQMMPGRADGCREDRWRHAVADHNLRDASFLRGVLLVAGLSPDRQYQGVPHDLHPADGGPGNVTEVTNYYSFLQAFNFSFLGFSSAITVALLAATCC